MQATAESLSDDVPEGLWAEKILKEENEKNLKVQSSTDVTEKNPKTSEKKQKKAPIKKKAKKVSKK